MIAVSSFSRCFDFKLSKTHPAPQSGCFILSWIAFIHVYSLKYSYFYSLAGPNLSSSYFAFLPAFLNCFSLSAKAASNSFFLLAKNYVICLPKSVPMLMCQSMTSSKLMIHFLWRFWMFNATWDFPDFGGPYKIKCNMFYDVTFLG